MSAIEARGLRVIRGDRVVLDGIELAARAGEVGCILGPNGAGKSTLLSALAGLLPYEGVVEIHGRDLSARSPRERAQEIAYVPQRTELASAMEVEVVVAQGRYAHTGGLGRPGAADRRAIAEALERTDIGDLVGRRFDRLSTGERRRVLLARALATEAKILLLDEPTEALDVRHGLELHRLLRGLAEDDFCVVTVLHDLGDARRATDHATLLRRGQVVASGPSTDVVSDAHVREVYGVALEEDAALGFSLLERT